MKKIIGISILLVAIVANTSFFNETSNDDSILSLKNVLNSANAQWGDEEDDWDDGETEYLYYESCKEWDRFDNVWVYYIGEGVDCDMVDYDDFCSENTPC